MSIATSKKNAALEKFMFFRLNPAKYIEPAHIGSSIYQMSFPHVINNITRNGVALTAVNSAPSLADQYYYDENSKTLSIKLIDPPDEDTNVIVCFFYIFLTGSIYRAWHQDPMDTSSALREWQPLIADYPDMPQSYGNILSGTFSISSFGLSLINNNGYLSKYFDDDVTFFNKDIDAWICLNSTDNIAKVFSGYMNGFTFSSGRATFTCYDRFQPLLQTGFMGVTEQYAYFRRDPNSIYPDLDPNKHGKPCPFIFGSSSRFKVSGYQSISGGPSKYIIDEANAAVCSSYSDNITTSTNRTWHLCRMPGQMPAQNWGAIQAVYTAGTGLYFVRFASFPNVYVGDSIKWVESGNTYYGFIRYCQPFTYLSVNYNIVIETDYATPSFTTGSTVANLRSMSLFISNGQEKFYPHYERDYTFSLFYAGGINFIIWINFVNNFESNFVGLTALNPQSYEVFYRIGTNPGQNHALWLEAIFSQHLNYTVDAASFAQAASDLSASLLFQVPFYDEDDYSTYLKYVQEILKSTLGYIKYNNAGDVEYHLLSAPASTNIRDKFLNLSTSLKMDYSDLCTQLIAYNPHNDNLISLDNPSSTSSSTRTNNKARYLQETVNVDRFRHVLEDITNRIDAHMAVRSHRTATYSFSTASEDIDSTLGDDVLLQHNIVAGEDEKSLKIVSISKGTSRTSIEAIDLEGL